MRKLAKCMLKSLIFPYATDSSTTIPKIRTINLHLLILILPLLWRSKQRSSFRRQQRLIRFKHIIDIIESHIPLTRFYIIACLNYLWIVMFWWDWIEVTPHSFLICWLLIALELTNDSFKWWLWYVLKIEGDMMDNSIVWKVKEFGMFLGVLVVTFGWNLWTFEEKAYEKGFQELWLSWESKKRLYRSQNWSTGLISKLPICLGS